MESKVLTSLSEEETLQIGKDLASQMVAGELYAFFGELGTGKTELIRGICTGLDVEELVSSPTFTIINEYRAGVDRLEGVVVYHIDLYRLENVDDLEQIGLPEILADPHAIKLVEWSERAESILTGLRCDIRVKTVEGEEGSRIIEIVDRRPAESASEDRGTVR